MLGSSGRKLIEQYLPAVPHSAVLGKQYAAIKEEDSKERCEQLRAALLETTKREYLLPHSEQLHRMQEYLQVIYSRYTEDVSKHSALRTGGNSGETRQ